MDGQQLQNGELMGGAEINGFENGTGIANAHVMGAPHGKDWYEEAGESFGGKGGWHNKKNVKSENEAGGDGRTESPPSPPA
ncbi:hypothetical protein GCM10023213_27930 [Prosthecobacter algae]|uniref:Uncharacterized protein n=1 Tax=Prosthecobacter algae TaxID=1144682 RepID=A0ABP9PBG3_9BACT